MSDDDQVFVGSLLLTIILCLVVVYFYGWDYPPRCEESPNAALIQAGRDLKVKSLTTGKQNAFLQQAAEEHAAYQARVKVQGHQGFEKRVAKLRQQLPDYSEFSECAAESWPGQNIEDAAKEMFHSWRQSPGHWSCINGKCDLYGYAMARGKNGTWYACAIFAKAR